MSTSTIPQNNDWNNLDDKVLLLARKSPNDTLLNFLFVLVFLTGIPYFSFSQITYSKSVYNRVNQDKINEIKPKENKPVQMMVTAPRGMTAQDIIRQNQEHAMNRMGYRPPTIPTPGAVPQIPTLGSKKQDQIDEIRAILEEDLPKMQNRAVSDRQKQTKNYRDAFSELMEMYNDTKPFSLKNAIFLIENAYLDKSLSHEEYTRMISDKVNLIKSLMQTEGIPSKSDLGKNYLIQKLFSEQTTLLEGEVKKPHEPYTYDFDDFWGEDNWSKMFVSKLLKTGKGQCHSLPLLYLILAEEMDTKAWLSLAPEHSFVIFNSDYGLTNFEATNGNIVTEEWLMQSGYINSNAIRNRIYLDTLGRNGLFSTLLADMVMGYVNKFGYDQFMNSMVDTLISINPKCVQGHIFRADLYAVEAQSELYKVGNPPIEHIERYPDAKRAYIRLMRQYDLIDQLGYNHMPKEDYESWLNSINVQKDKLNETDPK